MKTYTQFINEARTAESDKAFFDRIKRQASAAGDRFPELTASQAAIESGYGTAKSGKNNVFGEKGKGTTRRTREVVNGKSVYVNAAFRDFDSEEDSTKNRVKKWSYKYGDAKDLESAARNLQLPPGAKIPGTNQKSHGVYATDPNYVSTLTRIAREQGGSGKSSGNSGSASSSFSRPTISKGSLDTPSSTRVLAKLKGKSGELDKSTGKFSTRGWSNTEGGRYKSYGGK